MDKGSLRGLYFIDICTAADQTVGESQCLFGSKSVMHVEQVLSNPGCMRFLFDYWSAYLGHLGCKDATFLALLSHSSSSTPLAPPP
jgi:hypothetical protein